MKNENRLSVVLPFVFYHGEKGWDLGTEFLHTFEKDSIPKTLLKFIPNFEIHLEILSAKGKPFQTNNLSLQLSMRVLQTIRNDPEEFVINLQEVYRALLTEKEESKRIELLRNLTYYIFRARSDADIVSKNAIIKAIEGDYMNMLEKIKFEGKLEEKLETARKMRDYGDSIEKIIAITGLSEEQLKENGIM